MQHFSSTSSLPHFFMPDTHRGKTQTETVDKPHDLAKHVVRGVGFSPRKKFEETKKSWYKCEGHHKAGDKTHC